jgi:hypothetical protein
MNKYGHSEMEEKVLNTLKQQYGNRWEAIDETIVLENQSAKNYNLCITAMVALQYWNQKRVKLFSTSEDF